MCALAWLPSPLRLSSVVVEKLPSYGRAQELALPAAVSLQRSSPPLTRVFQLPALFARQPRAPAVVAWCAPCCALSHVNLSTARQAVVPVMKDCKEIETCLECSAEKLVFVGEVFYYALKAVVHPTGPLFDATAQGGQGALTPLCVKALKRIFLMCDLDRVRSPPRCTSGLRCLLAQHW